eukprot:5643404-Prymnesium_polylepis.1
MIRELRINYSGGPYLLSMPNPISAYSTMSRSSSRAWGGEDHPKRANAANCSAVRVFVLTFAQKSWDK